ncbi:hypothetical protein GE061_008913 [Apolygus lucorum]|uniref:Carboxypeptidase n=1 Tax=Apolygus lucorum TaxID=248454 RepID=A0A8S9Y006_APOLU|nr:hypothetical protein GE061_008913 [Apolygus lucorum]
MVSVREEVCLASYTIMSLSSVVSFLVICIAISAEFVSYTECVEANYGKPLFLTPLIEKGQLQKARQLSKVPSLVPGEDVVSYAGYFTVNAKYNSNMFFWYFPAEQNATKAPVAVWLQGGPGGSSLYGLFEENGPLKITRSLSLQKKEYYWSKNLHVIYIDNPVGTGFSFTDDDAGYATNEVEVGQNLYEAVLQFFTMFPDLQKNEFYVTGESYAGHYVPALGHAIHQKNPKAAIKINLAGVAIGDGWIDPVYMMVYDDYLYQHGFIDGKTQQKMKKLEANVVKLINEKKFHQANNVWNNVLALFSTAAGNVDIYDYLVVDGSADWPDTSMSEYLAKPAVRKSIHVGNLTYHSGTKVYNKLYNDMPTSVAP